MTRASIVVTGTRVQEVMLRSPSPVTMVAQQEELGDLKLYRIPEPVTVAVKVTLCPKVEGLGPEVRVVVLPA